MEKGKLYIIKTIDFNRKGIVNQECSHLIKDFYFKYKLSRTQNYGIYDQIKIDTAYLESYNNLIPY